MRSQAPRLILVMQDGTGSTGQIRMAIQSGASSTAGLSALDTLRALASPLSGCTCLRQSLSYTQVEDPRGTPAEDSDSHRVGIFIFTTVGGDNAILEVPGILDSMLKTTGPAAGLDIDPAAPAVANFISALLDNGFCNPFGDPLDELDAAYLQIRI